MVQLSETELKWLIQGGETSTIELQAAAPCSVEMVKATVRYVLAILRQFGHFLKGKPESMVRLWL